MFLNKKARWVTITRMILVLLVIVVFALVFNVWLKAAERIAGEGVCETSLGLMELSNLFGTENVFFDAGPECNTERIFILKDNEELGKEEKEQGFEEVEEEIKNPKDVKRALANKMVDWWLLEGTKNPWGEFSGDVRCINGAIIRFSNEIKRSYPELKEFEKFLDENKVPRKNITYLEYFTRNDGKLIVPESGWNIKTDEDHAVVFFVQNKFWDGENYKWWNTAGTAGAALVIVSLIPGINVVSWTALGIATVGGLIGTTAGYGVGESYTPGIIIIPHKEVKNICDTIEN